MRLGPAMEKGKGLASYGISNHEEPAHGHGQKQSGYLISFPELIWKNLVRKKRKSMIRNASGSKTSNNGGQLENQVENGDAFSPSFTWVLGFFCWDGGGIRSTRKAFSFSVCLCFFFFSFFFFIYVSVRASLRAPRLILRPTEYPANSMNI